MAKELHFIPPPYDPREALVKKVQAAPAAHAEAILDAYQILQLLRERGILEITKGALASGDKVLGSVTETIESDAVVSFLRNGVVLAKIVGGLNPELLEGVQGALARSAAESRAPGIFGLLRLLLGRPVRTALWALGTVLHSLGTSLAQDKAARHPGVEHTKTTRHQA